MNNYKKLTGRYIKSNKKRSILTIIGIVLSIALIATIGLFFQSMKDSEIEYYKKTTGEAQIMFTKPNQNLVSQVQNNPKVSRSGLYNEGTEFNLDEKTIGKIIVATDKALELMPTGFEQGKMPKSEGEVAIEKWVLSKIDKNSKLGSTIKINNKNYILVGILEDNSYNQISEEAKIYTASNSISLENAKLLVEISEDTNLTKAVNELKALAPKEDIEVNNYLLTLQGYDDGGPGNKAIYAVLSIVIGIVLISTIAVIYNSFQISVVDRIRQFGLLRAVGATKAQIKRLVFREASILAAIGIPIGLLCSLIATYCIGLVFKYIGGEEFSVFKLSFSPKILLISAALGIVTIYCSALIPAHYAGKVSPLYAISGRMAVVKENIKRKRGRLAQKIFGFEGAMAHKNLKRNKRRYRITVFSIVISVVLFISFKYFMDMSLNLTNKTNESSKIDFRIGGRENDGEKGISDKVIEDIKKMPSVDTAYYESRSYGLSVAIDNNKKLDEIKEYKLYKDINYNGKSMSEITSAIVPYSKEYLEVSKNYLESGTINLEELNNNGVILIKNSSIYSNELKKSYAGPISDLKVGDEIFVQYNDYEQNDNEQTEFGKNKVEKLKIVAVLEDEPLGYQGDSSGLKLVFSEDMAKKLTGKNTITKDYLNIVLKDDKFEEEAKTQIEAIVGSDTNLINNIDTNRTYNSSVLIMKILLYGFVAVISLIGSVNIINTLTTNIILRRREFATLKSLGLTQKGLRKMIIIEGFIYGIYGTVYGSLIGSGLAYLMYKSAQGYSNSLWQAPWQAIAIAAVAAMLLVYLSVQAPLKRIKKDNLIEAVREDF